MSGFRKSGVYPLNPGMVRDRQVLVNPCNNSSSLSRSKSDSSLPQDSSTGHEDSLSTTPAFTREEHARYQSRSEEGYDIHDPTKRKRKPALNSKTVVLTDTDVLEGLKHKACEKVRESV